MIYWLVCLHCCRNGILPSFFCLKILNKITSLLCNFLDLVSPILLTWSQRFWLSKFRLEIFVTGSTLCFDLLVLLSQMLLAWSRFFPSFCFCLTIFNEENCRVQAKCSHLRSRLLELLSPFSSMATFLAFLFSGQIFWFIVWFSLSCENIFESLFTLFLAFNNFILWSWKRQRCITKRFLFSWHCYCFNNLNPSAMFIV